MHDSFLASLSILFLQPASVPPISKLGPDALLEPMALDEFIESLEKKKLAIKTLLLDQVKLPTPLSVVYVHCSQCMVYRFS